MGFLRTISAVSAIAACLSASAATAGDRSGSGWPWIGKNADMPEIKLGGAFYDFGPATSHDEDGFVVNGEVLLPSPEFLSRIGSPRPYFGADVAFVENGTTPVHVAYAGLNWQAHWSQRFYTSASLGGSYNTADLNNPSPNHWGIGCNWLFHIGLSAGFDVTERVSVEAFANHYSNANQCFSNGGLESSGLRVGLKF
jgi:lipid A 3-O-deacylase